jgi:hypothetical protein
VQNACFSDLTPIVVQNAYFPDLTPIRCYFSLAMSAAMRQPARWRVHTRR